MKVHVRLCLAEKTRAITVGAVVMACTAAGALSPTQYDFRDGVLGDPLGDFVAAVDDQTRHRSELERMCRTTLRSGRDPDEPLP
jgi:hypothetical protein